MDYPNYQFYCSYRTAEKLFPDLPDHQLHTVSEHLGFKLENHHNALADAEACAYIATKIIKFK
jgi:DNA polymerase-3 subunit epsilon